jgi:hypothetical protein
MLRYTPNPARYVGCAVWYAVPVCATIQLCIGCTTERDHERFSCSTVTTLLRASHSRNGKDGWYRLCAPRCECVGCTSQCGLYRGLGCSAPLFLDFQPLAHPACPQTGTLTIPAFAFGCMHL